MADFSRYAAAHQGKGSRDADSAEPMVLRVVWLHQESPETLEAAAQRFIDAFPGVDMPMRTGDPVLNPTNGGTVVWAGWASGGWASLGRTVIIDQGNGYKSLAAHLNSINVSSGQYVNANSVIGGTGGSGHGSNTYWGPHLHQGLYFNASVSGGGTYGGQSAQPTNVHYCRNGCANYYSWISNQQSLSY